MRYRLEKLGCYILIIVLLPYIVTMFLNGPMVVSSTNAEDTTVNVRINSGKNSESVQEDLEEEKLITMDFEDYGVGILAREIPVTYESETLKAQAILVRTRLYKYMEEHGSNAIFEEEFFTESEMQEAWGITKYAGYYGKLENAWRETEGQVLMYEEKLAYTPFFSLSNGSTRDGKEVLGEEYPYLKIKDCPLDIEATEQIQTVTLDETESEMLKLEVVSYDTAGYVLKVKVGNEEVSGEEFRSNYHLASSCFSVQEYEGKIRITTRGVGHGIGLSQYTANKMAENGNSSSEILEYFFEGCEINEVVDLVRNTKSVNSTNLAGKQ